MVLQLLQMVGFLSVVFAVSMAVSYAITARNRKNLVLVPIPVTTRVRMVGPGGAYRCYFIRQTKQGLVFSAPLQRDHYVPVRIGEMVMVQAPLADCIVTFRSSILSRNAETHEFTVALPERLRHVDRRVEKRDSTLNGAIVRVNGEAGRLVDLSASGAKLIVPGDVRPGDTVTVDLPMEFGTAYGWALETLPTACGRTIHREVRVKFEEPLSGLSSRSRRELYLGR